MPLKLTTASPVVSARRYALISRSMLKNKTIGIIGGMGPLATADLFGKIISRTQAGRDQEHLHILIDNNTNIPDRTAAILAGGEDPIRELVISARRLESAGADFLIMPCNTAHYFLPHIQSEVNIPVLSMLEETAIRLKAEGVEKVGMLATDGTIRSGVYRLAFEEQGIEILFPDEVGQKEVMRIIYEGVKAGNFNYDSSAFKLVCRELLDRGAQQLVLGCTELPLAFSFFDIDFPSTDPTMVLAEVAVRFAGADLAVK